MKIAVIGATGFVGSAILQEALQRGHEVTAIVRHPEKVKAASEASSAQSRCPERRRGDPVGCWS